MKSLTMKKTGVIILIAVVLLTGCFWGRTVFRTNEVSLNAGSNIADYSPEFPDVLPKFSTKDLAGNDVDNTIIAEKKLTIINIWGTFCPPCIGEMPELGEWAKELPDSVQIIGLVCDIEGEKDEKHISLANKILDKADADFLNIIANKDFNSIMEVVIGVPTTLFVDSEGNLVAEPVIGANVAAYKTAVEGYLSESKN